MQTRCLSGARLTADVPYMAALVFILTISIVECAGTAAAGGPGCLSQLSTSRVLKQALPPL